jgi:hypothetical protein
VDFLLYLFFNRSGIPDSFSGRLKMHKYQPQSKLSVARHPEKFYKLWNF